MNTIDIYIRDPYILPYNNSYYMYGKAELDATEFVVYKSTDLKIWEDAKIIFTPPDNFWADRDFWAPEVHFYDGKFYLFASFKSENRCRGTQIFVSDTPDGKFTPISDEPITPRDWECLDGTLYVDKRGNPHIVFSHEWTQIGDGTVCEMELSKDLTKAISKPRILWKASDCKYSQNIDFNGKLSLVTDGPFLYKADGNLYCIWSSSAGKNYMQIVAKSDNGDIDGKWNVLDKPLFENNGGHGMIFKTFEDKALLVLHSPNIHSQERAKFFELKCENGKLAIYDLYR